MFEGKSYDFALTLKKWTLKNEEKFDTKKNLQSEWFSGIVDIPGTYYSDIYAGDFTPKTSSTVSREDEIELLETQVDQNTELIALYKQLADTTGDDAIFDLKVQIGVLEKDLGYA